MPLKSLKLVLKRKINKFKGTIGAGNIEIGHIDRNNLLEDFITKKEIKCYEYTDFREIQSIERGNVVRARFEGEFFALKSLNDDDITIRKVIDELKLLYNIDHENILKFNGISRIEGDIPQISQKNKYLLVLEYANSGTLSTYLDKHFYELNWNDKYRLAFQLASAVLYLHDNKIIHQELYVDNILVHQKVIKLASFGLPSVTFKESSNAFLFDIIPYMDPKSFNTKDYELGNHSDVYSVGVLLWQISSGCQPFRTGGYNANLATAILSGQREDIIDKTPLEYKCWKLEPAERPSMRKVVTTLETLLNQPEILVIKEDNEKIKDNNATEDDNEEIKDNAAEWVKNILKNKEVQFIPFNDLKNSKLLSVGAFGSVMKAVWTKTDNFVVYKRLINTATKYNALDVFIHELKIHLHLLPNYYSDRIVRCLDVTTKEYLLVMQYANGGDLQNYLNNRNLSWNDKKKLSYQIADGLNYLHNENVLHKDLHSKNIVIHEGNAKIIDFGISKIQDQISGAHTRYRGIIAYIEPKRLLNLDFHILNPPMFIALDGQPPFKDNYCTGGDIKVLALNINNGKRENPVSGTPKEYEELYKKCWNQEPDQRPITKDILDELIKMNFEVNEAINHVRSNVDLENDLFIPT
ncbi:kinase-like protein [Rhizophagus irregularis]|uniref:Kinase-like protein n=1 Tax=Rhizophagus irregularis TaxID=588596 RepID=A0A2N0SEP6_9GLOM|nr:kinase-like protein [Rhizophagus irregularis]